MFSRFDPITLRLFRRVLLHYALVAALVAAGQAAYEHRRLVERVDRQIDQTVRLFVPTLSTALWNIDHQLALSGVLGIAQSPYVLHVAVHDTQGAMRLSIAHDPETGSLVPSQSEVLAAPQTRRLAYRLSPPEPDAPEELGQLAVYLNGSALAAESLRAGLTILLNTGLMAAVLAIVLMIFGTTFLGRPIRALTEGVRGFGLADLGRKALTVDTAGNEELKILQNAFNDLAARLAESIEAAQAARLEAQAAHHLTDKLTLERALAARSRQLLEDILDSSPVPTFVIDAQHAITHWDRACDLLLGTSGAEMLGRTDVWRVFYPEARPLLADLVVEAAEAGRTWLEGPYAEQYRPSPVIADGYEGELWVERRQCWFYCTATPIRDGDGRVLGAIETLQDVTERRRAEESTRAALARQRELNDLKNRFVSMTSHEFRTPLTTVLSSAELLRHYGGRLAEGERDNLLLSIETAVRRMTEMLDNILLIGRGEAGRLGFAPAPVDIVRFCRDLVGEFRLGLPAGLSLEFSSTFPERPLLADERLLRHILANLLSNAVKYSPNGGTIHLGLVATPAGELVVRVADSGIGIPEADIPHLFESFQRASNVGAIPGTGLGLAIVAQAVAVHGGRIEVANRAEGGCEFVVTLPGTLPVQVEEFQI